MKELDVIKSTLESADNEHTRAPYWLILDPHQMMRLNVHDLASMIYGPFFCREDATEYLERRRYHFSKHARVYCHSGHHSDKYENLCKALGKV